MHIGITLEALKRAYFQRDPLYKLVNDLMVNDPPFPGVIWWGLQMKKCIISAWINRTVRIL